MSAGAEWETVMSVQCAWCKLDMGVKDGKGATGVTSAICPVCFDSELEKLNAVIRRRHAEKSLSLGV